MAAGRQQMLPMCNVNCAGSAELSTLMSCMSTCLHEQVQVVCDQLDQCILAMGNFLLLSSQHNLVYFQLEFHKILPLITKVTQ